MREPKVQELARRLYSPELLYHNFDHALRAVRTGEEIVRHCHEEGIRIDGQVVYYALLFHDAGYIEDHKQKGFESKEAYSAHLAAEALRSCGVRESVIHKVQSAINSTRRDAPFLSAEEKAVRAADLSGLAADYEDFTADAEKLRQEHAMLTGEQIPWTQWKKKVAETIRFYLAQEIRLTSYYADAIGKSVFHNRVRENLRRLLADA